MTTQQSESDIRQPRTVTGGTDATVGQLISDVSTDVSRLVRQEIELAKAELRTEAATAGRAAGMFGVAGFAGYMTAVLGSLAVVFALGNAMDLGWAALIVAAAWAIAGGIGYWYARRKLRDFSPVPRQTVETLKEDARWLRHPTR